MIAGSVNGQDVATNSLTGANINEASLTGDARKLLYVAREPLPAGPRPIATVGPYTIKGQCEKLDASADAHIYVNGPAGTADSTWSQTRNDSSDRGNHGTGFVIPANTDTDIVRVETLNGTFDRAGGTSMLRSGPTLVQVDFNAVVDYRSPSSVDCFIYGPATKAT